MYVYVCVHMSETAYSVSMYVCTYIYVRTCAIYTVCLCMYVCLRMYMCHIYSVSMYVCMSTYVHVPYIRTYATSIHKLTIFYVTKLLNACNDIVHSEFIESKFGRESWLKVLTGLNQFPSFLQLLICRHHHLKFSRSAKPFQSRTDSFSICYVLAQVTVATTD